MLREAQGAPEASAENKWAAGSDKKRGKQRADHQKQSNLRSVNLILHVMVSHENFLTRKRT